MPNCLCIKTNHALFFISNQIAPCPFFPTHNFSLFYPKHLKDAPIEIALRADGKVEYKNNQCKNIHVPHIYISREQ